MEPLRDLGFPTPSGVGSASLCPVTVPEREAALNAASVLQLRRAELAVAVAKGSVPGADIAARGHVDINRWMGHVAHGLRELLSVRPAASVAQLRISLPNNRLAVTNGMRMTSVFDIHGLTDDGRMLLATEDLGTYLLGICPVQMKIFDRKMAVLQGPTLDGEPTVMTVSEPGCMAAVWNYWHRIMDSASPVAEHPATSGLELSVRQRQIVALLSADTNDDTIASTLGVSVRTVRYDIAEVMRILGVRSRFAAGVRFHELSEAPVPG